MIVELVVDGARLRRWHLDLAERIRRERLGTVVQFRLTGGPALPSSVELLLSLEALIHRLPRPRPGERVEPGTASLPRLGDDADAMIDLGSGQGASSSDKPCVRVLYDGGPDEGAVFAALLEGRAPTIEIEDPQDGRILARGLPSIENASGIAEAYEAVVARVPTLLAKAVSNPAPAALEATAGRSRPPGGADAARFAARSLAVAAVRRLYRLCFHAPHWRIGWRFVSDRDVWDAGGLDGPPWNVLPDPGTRFYADPFPVVWRGEAYLFCEDFDHATGKGVISAAAFDRNGPAAPMRPVLEEAWHLSYPFLVEHAGEIFMIPESSASRAVTIYRAAPFPWRWVAEANLLDDIEASDATIVRKDGRYWMFATTRDGSGSHSDTLSIFMADDLFGPWTPHAANPVLVDAASARPAGNIVERRGRLWRPVQDCRAGYGAALGLAEIVRLDEEGFEQVVRRVLTPDPHWPGRKLHTLNRAGPIEVVDGSAYSPKLAPTLGRGLADLSRGVRARAARRTARIVSE